MPPQWTQPLDVATISKLPPTINNNSPTIGTPQNSPDVPPTVKQPKLQSHRKPSRSTLRLSCLFQRTSDTSRARPIVRLNRLHPPLPSDLSHFAPPVRSEFLKVSAVAAKKYITPPDPADDHDHSIFEFPSVLIRNPPAEESREPRRRNIHHLIQRYSNNTNSTQSSPDPPSQTCSTVSPTPSPTSDKQHQFNIRTVRDIFERHNQSIPEHTDVSLSSVTASVGPSDASHPHLTPHPNASTPPTDNRPRRIAFADLANTLDLSPCASSTSDTHPDHRQVPVATPPPHTSSSSSFLPEKIEQHHARKKSFILFRPVRRERAGKARSKSFANGETPPMQNTDQPPARRLTNAQPPKKGWVSRRVTAYGGGVRRRFKSFRNMTSDDC